MTFVGFLNLKNLSSFLIQKTKFLDEIRNIILFGSVSRSEEEKESDIDLFVDVTHESGDLEENIMKCLDDFLKSSKYTGFWKMLDVKNEIKLTIGNLDEWKQLHPSIISNGISIYGKFKLDVKDGKHKTLFVWENIKPNSKRVLFNKQLLVISSMKSFTKDCCRNIRQKGSERVA